MSAAFKNYYEILGVDRKATESEIKAAYRKAARKYHPDLHTKSDKSEAEEKFKEVNEAYTVLSDPEKRAQYDLLGENGRSGREWQQPDRGGAQRQTWNAADIDGFSDFFESMFGRAGGGSPRDGYRQTRNVRGQDLEGWIDLTLEEAYHGGQKSLHFSFRGICTACDGSGITGQSICRSCGGTGTKSSEKKLDVNVPAFVREGSKIRLKGQGGEGSAKDMQGDLLLTIRILPHPHFSLKGNTLETSAKIFPQQAVLGCQISVPTLDGEVLMTVPPMFHNGKKLRLKSKGWMDKDGSRGDEYVKITIDIPASLKPGELEMYRQLAELRKEVCGP